MLYTHNFSNFSLSHTTKSSPPPPPPVYYQPPKRESKAIPIVAPKPDTQKEIESLLISLENKPTHEKKQLLGDKLFPLVKVESKHCTTLINFSPYSLLVQNMRPK